MHSTTRTCWFDSLQFTDHVYWLTDVCGAVVDVVYACECACMAYFGNGNFREFLRWAGGFVSFRTGIPDDPGAQLNSTQLTV